MADRQPPQHQPCPVTFALDVFGDRWSLLVLRDVMLEGRCRYKDLLTANPGLATNVLADRLKRLERRGLLSRQRDPSDARQYLYTPTELAVSVVPILVEMIAWGARHGNGAVSPSFLQRFDTDRDGLVADLQQQIRARAVPPNRAPPSSAS